MSDDFRHKRFDPLISPYQLIYQDDETGFTVKSFTDLCRLAEYVGKLGLTRYDYAVIHGELLKSPPTVLEHDAQNTADVFCGTDSMIRTAPPEEIKALVESRQP